MLIIKKVEDDGFICKEFTEKVKLHNKKFKVKKELFTGDFKKGDIVEKNASGIYEIQIRVMLAEQLKTFNALLAVFIIIFCCIWIVKQGFPYATGKMVNEDSYKKAEPVSILSKLIDINEKQFYEKYDPVSVNGFNPEADSISFKNINTSTSPIGNCFGIAYLEKMIYSSKILEAVKGTSELPGYDLKDLRKPIGSIKLTDTSIKGLYDSVVPSEKLNLLTKNKSIGQDILVKNSKERALDMFGHFYNRYPDIFRNIDQTEVKQMLLAINYYQVKQDSIRPKAKFAFNRYPDITKFWKANLLDTDFKQFDIFKLTEFIDNQEILVVCLSNANGGHALVAYAYEKVIDNTYKVYVTDPNIPLFDKGSEHEALNEDIKKHDYIIFKQFNDKWEYYYNPIINGMQPYDTGYNSLFPDSTISIY